MKTLSFCGAFLLCIAVSTSSAGAASLDLKSFGAAGDGKADDAKAFGKALAAAGKTPSTIAIPQGTYSIGTVKVPENVTLKFAPGAVVDVKESLEIDGGLEAGLQQIFAGAGKVSGKPKTLAVFPQWFGAQGDGKVDDSAALQKAAALAQGSAGRLLFIPEGRYKFENDIDFRCSIECNGVLVKELSIDESKTTKSLSTFCSNQVAFKNPSLRFLHDGERKKLDPAFFEVKEGDFRLKNYAGIPLADDSSKKIDLEEGGTLQFSSSDFFTSRDCNKGDEWYDKNDYCTLVSPLGEVYPEFNFPYSAPANCQEWSAATVYKKGDYCKAGGNIYKAVWTSGPETKYTNKFLGAVDIGPHSPAESTVYKFTYKDGQPESLTLWIKVATSVFYYPPQAPLTVNGLTVEIYLLNTDGKSKRLWESATLRINRSNIAFNNLSVSCKSRLALLGVICAIDRCANITFNNSRLSGGTHHGLGYNILHSNCANITYNNCISVNCRDGIAGRHAKNVTVNGGHFNRIDDHYGRNFIIRNASLYAMSTDIPGYRTPAADEQKWFFKPSPAFAFGGGNILIENCRIYDCSAILGGRGDSGDLFGTVTIRNVSIQNNGGDACVFDHAINPTFDYAHKIRTPDRVVIEDVTINAPNRLFLRVAGFASYGPVLVRGCNQLGNVQLNSGAGNFQGCDFVNSVFKQDASQIYNFRDCTFSGRISGLDERNVGIAAGNLKAKGASVPFPMDYRNPELFKSE